VAILARRFGPENLALAEDVVQDALLKAMQTWPFTGVPDNPSAWILQTARNRAIDHLRRSRQWQSKEPMAAGVVEDGLVSALRALTPRFEDEIQDSQLRLMFVCCHPGLPADAQVALTLKVLGGFGEREIAAAFLAHESAIAKRLVRARQFLREEKISTELPRPDELAPRLAAVHQALYLMFNEGYKASQGSSLLREDLCAEAIRLGELVASFFDQSHASHALLALMYFNAARLPARTDPTGNILLLLEQDRASWDRTKISRGLAHLTASAGSPQVNRFHLEAGIAACHALAPNAAATDWEQILDLYDQLLRVDPSPVAAVNRAVAVAKVRGAAAGLQALATMADRQAVEAYSPLHVVSGQLWLDHGQPAKAVRSFRRAWELATLEVEREHLARRIAAAEKACELSP